MFSSTRDLTAMFREASAKYGLSETEFVFIFPWLQEGANGASPFVGSDTSILDKVKQTYGNCILTNIYGYIALFDAFKMLAVAGRRILNKTGQFSSVTDGKVMWNAMRRMTTPGMVSNAGIGSGTVMLDDLAERVPFYSAFFVDKNRNQ
ncbi:hypothetical protein ANCDUO_18635, partial [Ancylostoma duodenale]